MWLMFIRENVVQKSITVFCFYTHRYFLRLCRDRLRDIRILKMRFIIGILELMIYLRVFTGLQ